MESIIQFFKDIWIQIVQNRAVHLFAAFAIVVFGYLYFSERPESVDINTEVCGFLLDIILFGVILTIYNGIMKRGNLIRNYHEQFEDYRHWGESEGLLRKVGIIKRLNELNAPLPSMFAVKFKNANLKGINLHKAYLRAADLQGADLTGVNLREANLETAALKSAFLDGAEFIEALNMDWVQLKGAIFGPYTILPKYLKDTKPDWYNGKFDDEIE